MNEQIRQAELSATEALEKRRQAMKEKLLDAVVRLEATSHRRERVGFMNVYFVPEGLETKILRQDERVRIAEDMQVLEAALADERAHTILVPLTSRVTEGALLSACKRYSLPKTLFVEVSDVQ